MARTAVHRVGAPPTERAEATANMSSRLRVMPCWKMVTGQPVPGMVQPLPEVGMATRMGITFCVTVGFGMKLLELVAFNAMSPPAELCQESVSAAVDPAAGTVR